MAEVLLVHLSYLVSGCLFLRLFRRPGASLILLDGASGYLVGLVLQSSLFFAAAATGLGWPAFPRILTLGGLFALPFWMTQTVRHRMVGRTAKRSARHRLHAEPDQPAAPARLLPDGDRPGRRFRGQALAAGLLLGAALTPPVALLTLRMTAVPLHTWDAVATWGVKAKYLSQGETLWSDAFRNLTRLHPQPAYPLFYPCFMAQQSALGGAFDDLLASQGVWLFTVGALFILGFLLAEWTGPLASGAALGVLLYTPAFCGSPLMDGGPASAYADFPLALWLALAAAFALRHGRWGRQQDLVVAAACLTALTLTKSEGVIWAVVLVPFLLAAIPKEWKRKPHLVFFAFPFVVWALFRLAFRGLPPDSVVAFPASFAQVFEAFGATGKAVALWAKTMVDFRTWGILPGVVLIALIFGFWRNRRHRLAWVGLAPAACVVVGWGVMALTEVQLHMFDVFAVVTYPRLLVQIAPLAVFVGGVTSSGKGGGSQSVLTVS